MAPVTGGLTVAPGAAVTLTFADGRKMQIELSVRTSAGAAQAGAAMGAMPGMNH